MKASKITKLQWERIRCFKPEEFVGSQFRTGERHSMLPFLNADVIWAIARLRRLCGQPMTPSPARGAIARTWSEHSQHYISEERPLSTAIDLMVLEGSLETVYNYAKDMGEIGGFGAYPQWKPHHGIHIDIRPWVNGHQATWMAVKGKDGQVYSGLDWEEVAKKDPY